MIQEDMEGARNLKLLLYAFETMSGLKINFEKTEVVLIQDDVMKQKDYADLFNCQMCKWPIIYLGAPVCARRITVAEMKFLDEKLKNKMGGWMGGSMSIGGRVIKIDSCLASTVVYQMSLGLLHKSNTESLEKHIRSFLWAGGTGKKRYHLVKWKLICKPRNKGGLGIKKTIFAQH